jgi:hypothetical protein
VAGAAAARRPAEQEAGKRRAITIDLTLDDDSPVKLEEGSTAAAAATSRRRQGRGGGRTAGLERPAARVAKPAAAAGRGARGSRSTAVESVASRVARLGGVVVSAVMKRDCCVCGEVCVMPAGVSWRAARCPEHQGQ